MPARRLTTALLVVLLTAAPLVASAAGIRISPVRLYLAAAERATAVTVTNEDDDERRLQVQVERWTQTEDGKDTLSPAPELIANPPLFVLQPGQSRTVRVGFLELSPADTERAYRVFIREVPAGVDAAADPASGARSGIQVLRRFDLPLFRAPVAPERRDLQWSVERVDGRLNLRAHNRGNVHERRSDLKIHADADNRPLGHASGINDVLPGSTKSWQIDASVAAGTRLRLESISDRTSRPVVEFVTLP